MTDHKKHDQETEESIKRIVDQHGWFVGKLPATDYLPSFCYTIGLWKNYQHPELISFGLTPDTLGAILNIGGEMVEGGQRLEPNQEYDEFFEQGTAMILDVDERNLGDYFGYGLWYNGGAFPAMQIVWKDRNGKFPWEDGFEEEFIYRQPLLDRNFDFKFREAKNLGVFTTRQHLELDKPILTVLHDEEGDWQFLTNDQEEEDARVIYLEDIIKRDATLNELFNLGYGEYAERGSLDQQWIRGKWVD